MITSAVLYLEIDSVIISHKFDNKQNNSDRRGRMAVPHAVLRHTPAAVRRAREASLGVKGVKIFNLLPVWLRNLDGVTVDQFKGELDKFLSLVPDEPTLPGRGRAATTNSLLDQLQLLF